MKRAPNRYLLGILVVAVALFTYLFLPDTYPEAAKRCAAIFIIAAGFWALEIFPVYVTSLIVVLLLCFTLAKPGGVLDMGQTGYTVFLAPFASPILMLFFGGFILAAALRKNHADLFIASRILSHFTSNPAWYLLGVIICTATLSMWISNTAATVIMLGMTRPVFESSKISASFRKALILAVPFSANIGGIATPIGTPPNALAKGFLSDLHIFVSFPQWMMLCLPLVLILLIITHAVLITLYLPKRKNESIQMMSEAPLSKSGLQTLLIAGFTILLWLTSPIHRIPESLTALLSAGTFSAMGLIDRNDIKNIDWDVLILMWGGLALGVGIEKTELGRVLVDHLFPSWDGPILALLFATLALLFSLFISNTAAAALILPIALETTTEHQMLFAITIALMCSVAMIFPISTPPNALAYSTGFIESREMIKAGTLVTLLSYLTILIGFWWIIPLTLGTS
ncbi:MAG: DASS family sodium-coupled anion symporter [Waddliaceae bacterium]